MIGSLGILLAAKQKGIIAEIAPLLKSLQTSEIYFSEQLLNTVLELAGETDINNQLFLKCNKNVKNV